MLHVISTWCVARGLHTIAPGHLSIRVGDGSRRSEEIVKKSRFAPFSAIIIIFVRNHQKYGRFFFFFFQNQPFIILLLVEGAVCLLVGCLTSQQQASVSQGRVCSDNFTCCHTEIEVADRTFYLTQSQYTDTGPTSPTADPITPGA